MKTFLCAVALLLASCGIADAKQKTFMPDNELWREDNINVTNISETEFNTILDVIENTYTPIMKKFGATFVLERDWADSTVNAWANQSGSQWIVHMYGGMARRSELSILGFGLVACHEVGHHLGGFPKYKDNPWASNEGMSDYFSTTACARIVFDAVATPEIPETGKSKCSSMFKSEKEYLSCVKGVAAGLELSALLAALNSSPKPSLDTPDTSQVPQTSDKHPAAQCRLDTYFAGAICQKVWDHSKIPTKADAVCQNRPRCWYAPESGGGGGDPQDPQDPPTPNPDGKNNDVMTGLINQFRISIGVKTTVTDDLVTCATYIHAQDIGSTQRCSHRGTDGSSAGLRLRKCGYRYNAVEILACGAQNENQALEAWKADRQNRYILQSRQYKKASCSSLNGYFVCIFGVK